MQRSLMFPLKGFRVLLVVFLLEFVQWCNTMAVEAIAAWRSTARAVLAMVVLLEFLGPRSRRRGLNVAKMRVHGHALADFGNAMLILHLRTAITDRHIGARLLLVALCRSRAANAKLCCLVGVGAGNSLDTLLGALSWQGGLGRMKLEVFRNGTCLLG